MREDRQSQWKILDECLWAQEKNHSHNDKKRHLALALCWLALWYSTTYSDAPHASVRANNSTAATEGALEKKQLLRPLKPVQTSERISILTRRKVQLKLTIIFSVWLWFVMASCQWQFEGRVIPGFALKKYKKQDLRFDSFEGKWVFF